MSTSSERARREGAGRGDPLVLAVDDEPAMLGAWQRLLEGLPIRLRCFQSAEETLAAMCAETPAVLVSDHRLPGMTGLELLERVRETWPAVQLALHTSDPVALSRAMRLRVPVLEKGAAPGELRSLVVDLLRP